MKWNRDYVSFAIGYLIVILYIVFVNNPIVNVILVLVLAAIHIMLYNQLRQKYHEDKTSSLSKLQTRLEKTAKQREEIYERFLSLSQSFGSGLLMVDEDGIIQFANSDINAYFGRDFNGLDYNEISEIKDLHGFINQAYLLETILRHQIHYETRYFDLISTPMFEDDMFRGTLILVHDITLLKTAEEYQKRFTADVSHELRTPLSSIKGFSEILARNGNMKDEERQEFIELIQNEANRMELILKDLSQIAQLDRLDYELERTSVDIEELVSECLSILRKPLEDSGLTIDVNVASETLSLDKHKFLQVLINMVKNAISYTDEGSITIIGQRDKKRYVLTIADTGIGIAEEDHKKIFKRFYRVDRARSRDTGGSGLGLSISKNTILKHGGSIDVASKLGEGTTFTITLPLKD